MSASSFVDYVQIFIKAGDGGDGHVGFYRGRGIPKGGPDGGDGGRGGDVILRASKHKSTLRDYIHQRHFLATNGQRGGKKQKNGASGDDIYLDVPLGTVARHKENQEIFAEVLEDNQTCVLAKGGRGGLGNVHFKSSTNQTPMQAKPGKTTEGTWIILELKLLADIALVGCPNAGKSTLLSALTRAQSKSANYPFTTLQPFLGVMHLADRSVRVADMPGLVANAHQGVGLGIRFLRHIERAAILMFVLEIDPDIPEKMWQDLQMLESEICAYNVRMTNKPRVIVANKADLLSIPEQDTIKQMFLSRGLTPLMVSARDQQGFEPMKEAIHAIL